jgi:hypothetical protein
MIWRLVAVTIGGAALAVLIFGLVLTAAVKL